MKTDHSKDRKIRLAYHDILWRHFSINVDQRLKIFQFFITISTALLGGALLLPKAESIIPVDWGLKIIGSLAFFFSILFWMLDDRTHQLLEYAKEAIRTLDTMMIPGDEYKPLRLFEDKGSQLFRIRSQTFCFRLAFVLVGTFGIIGVHF